MRACIVFTAAIIIVDVVHNTIYVALNRQWRLPAHALTGGRMIQFQETRMQRLTREVFQFQGFVAAQAADQLRQHAVQGRGGKADAQPGLASQGRWRG